MKRRPVYWTPNQLAERGEVPIETVRWWLKTKRLKSRKKGRARLIARKDALAALRERKQRQ